jgi:hypothetical protein
MYYLPGPLALSISSLSLRRAASEGFGFAIGAMVVACSFIGLLDKCLSVFAIPFHGVREMRRKQGVTWGGSKVVEKMITCLARMHRVPARHPLRDWISSSRSRPSVEQIPTFLRPPSCPSPPP